jgi:hypothetical protein
MQKEIEISSDVIPIVGIALLIGLITFGQRLEMCQECLFSAAQHCIVYQSPD